MSDLMWFVLHFLPTAFLNEGSSTIWMFSDAKVTSKGVFINIFSISLFMSWDHWLPVSGFGHEGHGLFLWSVNTPTLILGLIWKRKLPQSPSDMFRIKGKRWMKYYHTICPAVCFLSWNCFSVKTGLLRNFYAHDASDDLKNDVDEK